MDEKIRDAAATREALDRVLAEERERDRETDALMARIRDERAHRNVLS